MTDIVGRMLMLNRWVLRCLLLGAVLLGTVGCTENVTTRDSWVKDELLTVVYGP